ncbi:TetR/AcrR family transcriptional regulator [Yoonia sp. BS5-3]|uniref:TetR/AcrR family transcriptional regulator n=1 Tax=Yoonia phaeophyticola TaxID=3137369 RepID=A0ABZ2V4A3_9RHOB
MRKADLTRDKLLDAASVAFCTLGYSNASLRAIAKAADVDVALISRYFGGKLGLFRAALESAFEWDEILDAARDPIEVAIAKYADAGTEAHQVSAIRMIVMNASDPEVGDLLRGVLREKLIDPLQERMGGRQAASQLAMFAAVVLGASIVRQTLKLPGMAGVPDAEYADQLRYLINAAISFDGPDA